MKVCKKEPEYSRICGETLALFFGASRMAFSTLETALGNQTLAIVLGASEWPEAPEWPGSEAFRNSARDFKSYVADRQFFGVPDKNVLDLFDSEDSPLRIAGQIRDFLRARKHTQGTQSNLIIYFVGHGGFAGGNSEYYLAIRCTSMDYPDFSGIRIEPFVRLITNAAKDFRRFFILDCCYAGTAYKAFQSSGPAEVAIRQTITSLGHSTAGPGACLLCSSSKNAPSKLELDGSYTMFSKALIQTLKKGDPRNTKPNLSLHEVADLTERLLSNFGDDAPRPEVHSPDQEAGDVAKVGLFPNKAYRALNAVHIFSPFEHYRKVVKEVWVDKTITEEGISRMLKTQFDTGLENKEVDAIESEIMGSTKREILHGRLSNMQAYGIMQAYGMMAAAERQRIESDAREAVNTEMLKAATAMMRSNETDFQAMDKIVAGG